MVIAWTKQVGAKYYFRHESQMGHAIRPPHDCSLCALTPNAQKKDVVYGLLFFPQDLADFDSLTLLETLFELQLADVWLLVVSN